MKDSHYQHVGVFALCTWNFGTAILWQCPHATVFMGHPPCDFPQQQHHRSKRDVQSRVPENPGEVRRRDARKVPRHEDIGLSLGFVDYFPITNFKALNEMVIQSS